MTSHRKLLRINFVIVVSFFIVKFFLRPLVVGNNFPKVVEIFVLSYSNFCEAVVGSVVLALVVLYLSRRLIKDTPKIREGLIYRVSVLIAGVYVLLQEFKIHNLGGNNVYDPYDVLFSVIGLVVSYILLVRIKPSLAGARL